MNESLIIPVIDDLVIAAVVVLVILGSSFLVTVKSKGDEQ